MSLLQDLDPFTRGGIIVFFPNYKTLNNFKFKFSKSCKDQLQRESFFDDDRAFENFKRAVLEKKQRAILFSIMGGKLSEGINFKDQLARVVIAVGLPYPNMYAADIRAKMKYLDEQAGFIRKAVKGTDSLTQMGSPS
jgi:chromosome transmission fidelity protein 1